MWCRVAYHLLHCTLEEAQERMSSHEFTNATAFYLAEPFGFEVENFRAGTMTAAIVNQVAGTIPMPPGKHRKTRKETEFYPLSSKTKGQQPSLTPAIEAQIAKKRKKRQQHGKRADS